MMIKGEDDFDLDDIMNELKSSKTQQPTTNSPKQIVNDIEFSKVYEPKNKSTKEEVKPAEYVKRTDSIKT